MRGPILAVTILSSLIIICLVLLVYGMVEKGAGLAPARDMAALVLPKGSSVKQMTTYDNDLALYVDTPGGEYIYLYNPRKGAPEGRVAVQKTQ